MSYTAEILIHQIYYILPSSQTVFNDLSLVFSKLKTGLVGRNGIGKSTLIKLIVGENHPHSGFIQTAAQLSYVPQQYIVSEQESVADVLGYSEKINALQRIRQGSVAPPDFMLLNEEWDIEERLQAELALFGLETISFYQPLYKLSGGELTRLLLTRAFCSDADFILLDEPTNHLDSKGRAQLYHAIKEWHGGLIVVSHDRTLLNLMDEMVELSTLGTKRYGGNYDEYQKQKNIETQAKTQQLSDAKKTIDKTKRSIQSAKEKHEKRQAQGRDLRRSGSQPKMLLDAMKNRSTKSQGDLLTRHDRMLNDAENKLHIARREIEVFEEIRVDLPETTVPTGKVMIEIENVTFSYSDQPQPIINHFNFILQGPERIALAGDNGGGKTTLIKLILGELKANQGSIYVGTEYVSYLDQQARQLQSELSVLENFMRLNPDSNENDAYRSLALFLFKNVSAQKLVKTLSGGEKLRALLACILLSAHPPQLLILDEPTNHLNLDSIKNIESALKNYQGAMIIISHDQKFLEEIGINRVVHAPFAQ